MSIQSPNPATPYDLANADLARSANAAQSTRKIRLGEELPIFCEKCGYALHGLAQQVCAQCSIRHFHCPECAHHQPINTLRPAAQKILGRLRAVFLGLLVFLKINFFGWILFAFVNLGYERAYQYDYEAYSRMRNTSANTTRNYNLMPTLRLRELDTEEIVGFSISGFFFGVVGRMLLLRWRRGYLVGLTLATLVFLALASGALLRSTGRRGEPHLPNPFTGDFVICMAIAFSALTLGASVVWVIWSALVHLFLPKRTGQALLDWQREQSIPAVAHLGKE